MRRKDAREEMEECVNDEEVAVEAITWQLRNAGVHTRTEAVKQLNVTGCEGLTVEQLAKVIEQFSNKPRPVQT